VSCLLSTSHAILGQVMGMTWTPPSFTHAMPLPVLSRTWWIHWNAGLPLSNISGRLPTTGHGVGERRGARALSLRHEGLDYEVH